MSSDTDNISVSNILSFNQQCFVSPVNIPQVWQVFSCDQQKFKRSEEAGLCIH